LSDERIRNQKVNVGVFIKPRRNSNAKDLDSGIRPKEQSMKAIVAEKAGTPDVLTLKEIAKPDAKAGWVLIKVKAFGLNRAELFTRQGDSPGDGSAV
jgi:hypothetical protein